MGSWQVFPAFRRLKMSPGMASNTVSMGTRLSAQPSTALCGACPEVTSDCLSVSWATAWVGWPFAKRALPRTKALKKSPDLDLIDIHHIFLGASIYIYMVYIVYIYNVQCAIYIYALHLYIYIYLYI